MDFGPLNRRLVELVRIAHMAGELRRDDSARHICREVYRALSEGKPLAQIVPDDPQGRT
jgi:hypothetical protein